VSIDSLNHREQRLDLSRFQGAGGMTVLSWGTGGKVNILRWKKRSAPFAVNKGPVVPSRLTRPQTKSTGLAGVHKMEPQEPALNHQAA
jgi:hypothetical protein